MPINIKYVLLTARVRYIPAEGLHFSAFHLKQQSCDEIEGSDRHMTSTNNSSVHYISSPDSTLKESLMNSPDVIPDLLRDVYQTRN